MANVRVDTNTSSNIYVINQNLEHVDDVSFRELFGGMGVVFFYKIRFVPSLDEVFVSTRTLAKMASRAKLIVVSLILSS
jgi:hypothetical protein